MDFSLSARDSIDDLRKGITAPAKLLADALDRIEEIDTTGFELNSILASAITNNKRTFDLDSQLAGLPIVIMDPFT